MSYDFKVLPKPCDHLVRSERLAIAVDHLTLYSVEIPSQCMTSPINGLATLKLRINGVDVPRNHPEFGWSILDDPFSIYPDKRSMIRFQKDVRFRDWMIEAEYCTIAAYCRKCGGTAVVTDYTVGKGGSLKRAVKREKLVQRSLKYLLTSVCRFYPTLTCQLREHIGRKYGTSLSQEDIAFEVLTTMETMKSVQSETMRWLYMEPEEILRSVDGVSAERDDNDPTIVRVLVDVSSPAGTKDQLNLGLKISV